jgi:hypothetical protein
VALACAVLVAASSGGPVQARGGVCAGPDDGGGHEPGDLVAGERNLVWRCGAGSLGGCGEGEGGAGEDGEGGPAVPGFPGADLMLVQAGQGLAGLEVLLGGPAPPGDLDQER